MSHHHLDNFILIGKQPNDPNGESEPIVLTHHPRRGHLYVILPQRIGPS